MKNLISILAIKSVKIIIAILVLLTFLYATAQAQSFIEMMDSSKIYQEKQEFDKALFFSKLSMLKAENEFGKNDTNYIAAVGAVSEIFYYLGSLDSAIYYGNFCLNISRKIYKTDNEKLAESISNMAFFYNKSNDYKQAEPLYKEVLEMYRRIFNTDHPDLAKSINNMAKFYNDRGEYKQAEPLYKEALEMNRRLYKTDNPSFAKSINNMAVFYDDLGNYRLAEPLYKEALEMRRRIYKTDHPDLATAINNIAVFYEGRGDYKRAEPLFKEVLEMCRRIYKTDNPNLANCINSMACFYDSRCDYKQAYPLYKESLEMKRRIFKTDHPDLATSINNLAYFYNEIGDYKQAESLYKESLEMYRRIFKTDHPNLATSINNLAYFYNEIGDYKQAEPLYKEALGMRRRIFKSDHPDLATSINNLASFYNDRGDYKQAEPLYIESLEMYRRIFKPDHPDLATSINNLASFYDGRGDYKQAETLYIEALAMVRRIFKTDNPDLVSSINNMAMFYKTIGDYKQAETLLIESLEMQRRIFKTDHKDIAKIINNMACFYDSRADYRQAEPLYIEALAMLRRIFKGDHPDLSKSIINMAKFYDGSGDYKKAEPLYIEALNFYQNMLNNYFPSLSENEKKLFWNTVSNNFEAFNSFAVKRYSENPSILCNMYEMQLYTKGLLFNSTSKIRNRIINSKDFVLIDKYKELSDKKEFLVKLYAMTNEAVEKKGFNIDSIEKAANELEKELSLKSELFAQSYEEKKITWKSIQTLLKPDEAAVEVVRFRFRDNNRFTDTVYYAFLIITDKMEEHPELVVLKNGNLLENEYYNNYRTMIDQKQTDKLSYGNYWAEIYEKLKDYKKIYFAPDGIYNKLNPATLIMPDGKYLLDIQDIQQVKSTKDILFGLWKNQHESNIYNNAVLIGNPNFSLEDSQVKEISREMKSQREEDYNYENIASTRGISQSELQKLPGTEKEIKDIEKFLNGKNWVVNSYLGNMAVKAVVKSVKSPRILHIATHAMFLEDVKLDNKETFGFEIKKVVENPLLRSGLFFTGANNYLKSNSSITSDDDNGLLTAYEAMNLDLDKTELVVLSACETGLGEVKNGEGVFGLRRAFQQAGAKTVIMSLWEVSDDATQSLMTNFYKNWTSGMSKREAFNKAQQEAKDKYKYPYYWGAFVMVGE